MNQPIHQNVKSSCFPRRLIRGPDFPAAPLATVHAKSLPIHLQKEIQSYQASGENARQENRRFCQENPEDGMILIFTILFSILQKIRNPETGQAA
jgi:hypothetical protein